MCGIIGYVGPRECKALLLHGLERLEYRGYDSAGIALLEEGGLTYTRAVGNLAEPPRARGRRAVARDDRPRPHALGDARRRHRGERAPARRRGDREKLAIVLNGIVENYRELRDRLVEQGHVFSSETDAETVTHLIEEHYEGDLVEAVRRHTPSSRVTSPSSRSTATTPACSSARGCSARWSSAIAPGETFLASNAAAFLRETRQVQFPDDGEIVVVEPEGADVPPRRRRQHGRPRARRARLGRRGRREGRLRDVHAQGDPRAARRRRGRRSATASARAASSSTSSGWTDEELRDLNRIVILSAGTSYHAAVAGRYAIEEWGRVPVEHDIASEWIYRNPVLDEDTLVIGISQSGETRDTIEAMKLARSMGARTVAITNMMGSQITREVDSVLFTRAGLEVSVAASKTFTAQLSLLFLVGLKLAQVRQTMPAGRARVHRQRGLLAARPSSRSSSQGDHPIDEIARRFHDKPFFLYLGRNIGLPVALEGALKLKEISYIPTEAYSAGEMKHGPIALLDENTPVVVVATRMEGVYEKLVSNIQEVRARGAHVIAIASDGHEDIQHHADDVIYVPKAPAFLSAVLAVVPLQLLAYRIARLRGLNVDQPRNLAKTVTVE